MPFEGRCRSRAGRRHTLPSLVSTEQREADVASHQQARAAFDVHLAVIDRARIRIENVAAAVLIVRVLHVADDDQTEDGLVLALVAADRADMVLGIRRKAALDLAEEPPVLLIDAHDGTGLPGLVV